MCESLWEFDEGFSNPKITDNINEIMKTQCNSLKEKTNGKVFAKFARIKRINPFVLAAQSMASESKLIKLSTNKEMIGDTDTTDYIDANTLYQKSKYGFEIYNKTYRFRVFELEMEPIYPLEMTLDEGISDDIRGLIDSTMEDSVYNKYIIESEEEFLRYLKIILGSKKVKYIVNRLLSLSD